MSDMLTQEEIQAMVANQGEPAFYHQETTVLTSMEVDTLGEIGNISMGSAATALFAILGRKVVINTPSVSVTTLANLSEGHEVPYLVVNVGYTEGFSGSNLFILQLDDVKLMTDIMMGGDGNPDMNEELTELHISAISEAMNQMMGGMSTAMADMFSRKVNITPPESKIVRLSDEELREMFSSERQELINISFKMEIEGLIDSNIMQLMPMEFGRELAHELTKHSTKSAAAPQPAPPIKPADAAPAPIPEPAPLPAARPAAPKPAPVSAAKPQQPVDIHPIQLASFDDPSSDMEENIDGSMDLILDVPLMITVELGQCRKTIKDILELNIGSVITLDKLAGEPVDVIANGKPVAKGEVIVVDDSYGIRITEVLTSANRIRTHR